MGSGSSKPTKNNHSRELRKDSPKKAANTHETTKPNLRHLPPNVDHNPYAMRGDRINSGARPARYRRERQLRQEGWRLGGTADKHETGEQDDIIPTDLERDFKAPDRNTFRRRVFEVPSECRKQEYSPLDIITKSPPAGQPLLKSNFDKTMAARQRKFHDLSPKEQEKQKEWAQHQITISKNCPGNKPWCRYRSETQNLKGLMCLAGVHLMTDALLAEGKGGMLIREQECRISKKNSNDWQGPFYFQNWLGCKSPFRIAQRKYSEQLLRQRERVQKNRPTGLLGQQKK
ncbi:hypothetical protein BDZ45DRAFT_684801 [Acephala macrosclerotiorum]|nr:hypothetical protein BDZ45DRAFT_684801 [Acephala macrosclerotiorum]